MRARAFPAAARGTSATGTRHVRARRLHGEPAGARGPASVRQSRHHREPADRQPGALPGHRIRARAARGRRHRGRELLRPGLRPRRSGEPARGARSRQRHRHDFRGAPDQLADGGHRRPAGHAASTSRPDPGPRPGGHGGAGGEVERPGRERRRDRTGHAARLQDRARCALRPGLRRAADQRDGAADRDRRTCRRPALPRTPAGRRRRRRHGPAPAGRQRARHHDRRRRRARGRGRRPGGAGGGRWRRHLDRADPPAPAGAQHASQLPGPHPHRPRHHRQDLRRG